MTFEERIEEKNEQIKEITTFIENFKRRGDRQKIEEFFLNGCCYWFMRILDERFGRQGQFLYDIKNNHFVYYFPQLNDAVFDIRGYLGSAREQDADYKYWDKYVYCDPLHYSRIVDNCVNLET